MLEYVLQFTEAMNLFYKEHLQLNNCELHRFVVVDKKIYRIFVKPTAVNVNVSVSVPSGVTTSSLDGSQHNGAASFTFFYGLYALVLFIFFCLF